MNYSEDELQSTEEEVQRYFRRIAEINKLKYRLEFLEKKRVQVEHDIDSSNVHLNVAIPSLAYDSDQVQSSGSESQQERALESAFAKLEKQLVTIKNEVLETNTEMRDLEYRNCDMEFVLAQLEEMAKEFICLHYGKKYGYVRISNLLHLSPASISRLRIKILSDIRGYGSNMKKL